MLADIRDGAIDAVLVYALDRLTRQNKELEEFFEICSAAGVTDLACVTGDIDLADSEGQFTARILGAVATKESDNISRRLRRKHAELAAAGKYSGGGRRPFGYEDDHKTIRPDEAEAIREMASRVLAGDSLSSIATDLNSRGILTSTGLEWRQSTIRTTLMSHRISGQRSLRGTVTTAEWPAIISPQDGARLRSLLTDPRRAISRAPRRYLLTGLLCCSKCGNKLLAQARQDRRTYRCLTGPGTHGCGGRTITADHVEELVVEAVLYRLDTPQLAHVLSKGTHKDKIAEAAIETKKAAQARLDELTDNYADGKVAMAPYLRASQRIEAQIASADHKLARISQTSAVQSFVGNSNELRRLWAHLTLSRQRAIVAALLDHAVIGPGRTGPNNFDPNRVTLVWRR